MDENEYNTSRRSMTTPSKRTLSMSVEVDELSNYEYFKFEQQHKLDDVISKVKAKVNKKQAISAQYLYNSVTSYFTKKFGP
jgi:hypothetical protein